MAQEQKHDSRRKPLGFCKLHSSEHLASMCGSPRPKRRLRVGQEGLALDGLESVLTLVMDNIDDLLTSDEESSVKHAQDLIKRRKAQ